MTKCITPFYFFHRLRQSHDERRGLLLDGTNDSVRRIPEDDLSIVKHVELLNSVPSGVEDDSLLSSRVVREELCVAISKRHHKQRKEDSRK